MRSLALPGRAGAGLPERAQRVAGRLARHLAADTLPDPRTSDRAISLASWLERGQALALAAKLDQAAQAFDAALADGLKDLDRLARPAELVMAHLQRASIYLAMNQAERAQSLIDRAHRYEPVLALVGQELRPRMRAALAAAQARQGPRPTLSAGDLGDACRVADVLVVARTIEGGVEFLRFDHCVQIASAVSASPAQDDEAALKLVGAAALQLQPHPPDLASHEASDLSLHGKPSRTMPLVLSAGAVALLATGGTLVALARSDYDDLLKQCGAAGDCAPDRYNGAKQKESIGYVLLGVGTAAAATAVIVWLVERRPRPATQVAYGLRF
jgi:tetratricopeptide (TPR) repeat protein